MIRMMTSLRLLLSTTFTLTFILLASHLIFQPPLSYVVRDKNSHHTSKRGVSHAATNSSVLKMNENNGKSVHFLIFDAVGHKDSLRFLDVLSTKWTVLIVNLVNESQLESCQKCQAVEASWSQKFLAHEVSSQTWKQVPSYAKEKTVAILYALWNSAEWLYVTDSKSLPDEETLLSVCSHQPRTAPVYRGPNMVFEPCEHFMDPYTWHGLKNPNAQGRYSVKVVSTDAIHMVVNNCYQKHMDTLSWRKGIDVQAPRPHIMAGTYSSINFRNVIVSRNMAWTLVASLPLKSYQSPSLYQQSVFLNLMIQRIFWDTSGMMGFLPISQSLITSECPSCDVNNTIHEIGLGQVDKLSSWRCKPSNNLVKCLEQLAEDLASQQISNTSRLGPEMSILLDAWLNIFSSYRFATATRVPLTAARLAEKHVGIHIQLTAAKSMHVLNPNFSLPPNVFANLCRTEDGQKYTPHIPTDHPITDILLVVIFNFPWLVAHIPTLEYTYGRHFRHVLYCAESTADFYKLYANRFPMNPVNFVEIPHRAGYWGHDCMAAAVRTGFQVAGYLQISDDVIVNVWNLHTLPRAMPWFQANLKVAHIDWKVVPDVWVTKSWWPWTLFCGQPGAVRVYERLRLLRAVPGIGEKVSSFLQNLHTVTGCERCLTYEASDIFYLPAKMATDFTFFSDIFSQTQVFLEIAIPSILTGLATDAGIYRLRGNYLWFQDRVRCPDVYTQYDHFYHAWKFSKFSEPGQASFYCREVIDRIDGDLMVYKTANTSLDS
ncbi:hypothetical protein ElyMa_000572100 [Elysia marginata]|uniref:Uncharacterized protein n=1 Tax=Elysia marginata TaxID=1093978 RepID=A0AAV4G336_9GAST|nr:hypothetical protein ElyMa_000572100 [Elysia marginata]